MGRPREFDEEIALNGAMDVFWALGYDGASLPELLEGMEITRGSMYKAYKDKRSLFMNILQRYDQVEVEKAANLLCDPAVEDGLIRIKQLFDSIIRAVEYNDHRGCLLCSAAAGPAHKDKEIAKVVHILLAKIKSGFEVALQQSFWHSKLSEEELNQIADLLITQYVGLRVLSRSQASIVTLKHSTSSLIMLLSAKNN